MYKPPTFEVLPSGGILVRYWAYTDHGHPVGKESTFQGKDYMAVINKIAASHQNAVVALERSKRKLQVAQQARINAEDRLAKLEAAIQQSAAGK